MQELTLMEIGRKCGTDKADHHQFLDFYEKYISDLRYKPVNILEIGIYHGESLKMWREYFPQGNIYGFDINDLKQYEEDRIKIEQGDQTDTERLNEIFKGVEFDIIIDDGGHTMKQQQISLGALFKRVKPNGIYILEDLHTSVHGGWACIEDTEMKTALNVVENICSKNNDFTKCYVAEEELQNILQQTKFAEVLYRNNSNSVTSIIQKN